MKVGVVGAGLVGATAAYAMVLRGSCSELVLTDVDMARATAEAQDIAHASPVTHGTRVSSGPLEELAGSRVVVVAAGANQQPGESRLELLGRNADIFRDLLPRVADAAPDAVLLIATNPVDVLTDLTARLLPGRAVLGSGTVLDSARLRWLTAQHAGVDATHIHASVLGEHGDSEVIAWSAVTVGGVPVAAFMSARARPWTPEIRAQIEADTRGAAAAIIGGKRATYYGIGAALARITERVLGDRRAVLTVSVPTPEFGVSLSLPRVVGAAGVLDTILPALDDAETRALEASADVLRAARSSLAEWSEPA